MVTLDTTAQTNIETAEQLARAGRRVHYSKDEVGYRRYQSPSPGPRSRQQPGDRPGERHHRSRYVRIRSGISILNGQSENWLIKALDLKMSCNPFPGGTSVTSGTNLWTAGVCSSGFCRTPPWTGWTRG